MAIGTLSVISWADQAHELAIARTMGMVTFALFAAPRPRLRQARRPALSGRRQGKSCSSAAGRVRPGAAGTSPPAISLAEHRVEFGVGPDRPDLLRAAAGDGDLGSPPQRLLA